MSGSGWELPGSPAAHVVDLDRLDYERVVEIGHVRVVEREVAVLADPDQREVDAAVGRMLDGPIEIACPASGLRRHPDAVMFIDEAAAAGVGR